MENEFILPISFEGKELELQARLLRYGYSVKIEVEIEGIVVVFELDEEQNWRAMMGYNDLIEGKKVKRELLEVVARVIEMHTK